MISTATTAATTTYGIAATTTVTATAVDVVLLGRSITTIYIYIKKNEHMQ